jgi:hypothetical protein
MCFLFNIAEKENIEILLINDDSIDGILSYRSKFLDKISKKDKIHTKYKSGIESDLIIINNNINKENDYIEILINETKNSLECLKLNGNLIIRVCDTYTMQTIKLLFLITSLFSESYIYKPFYSRASISEKFIICKNFENKNSKKIISILELLLKSIKSKSNEFIIDIFADFQVPKDYIDFFKFVNIKLVNQQQILINEIVKYIKDNNYFGDKYHEFRNQQIEATKWWVTNFYPPSNNLFKDNKENLIKLVNTMIERHNLEKEKFCNQLI